MRGVVPICLSSLAKASWVSSSSLSKSCSGLFVNWCIQQTWFPVVHMVVLGTCFIYLYRVEVLLWKCVNFQVYLSLGFLWGHSIGFPLLGLGPDLPSLPSLGFWSSITISCSMYKSDCPHKNEIIPMVWLLWILMCPFDLFVITILKTPELTILPSTVTSPSYVSQCEYRDLCLNDGSNTQLLPLYAFPFMPMGILHLIYPLEVRWYYSRFCAKHQCINIICRQHDSKWYAIPSKETSHHLHSIACQCDMP